jgi:hypothetical protein
MGEMASSVAHELNQPLTAITNYCNGMVSRVKADTIEGRPGRRAAEDRAPGRARRSDHPPHPRLREAQRTAAPAAQARQIVDDAVELAGIELRRRNVAIHTYVAQRLPTMLVDPILIEQVVLNLLKNAAEAIDSALLPPRAATSNCASCRATRRRRRRHRVQRHRHGPGHQGRGHRPPVRGLLLDQGRRPGHRAVAVPHDRGVAPRPDAGTEPLQWCAVVGCRFAFTLPVELPVRTDPAASPPEAETAHPTPPPYPE